ncbi:guanylate-binding protein 1-like [Mercenaria mercenaria]|uniref:guanylate-binding protein 1-like n=1 Tax=Mercenaria mercenaria TaxID=6596 RepID=UPI00234F50F6|nr:guanylate-binding protein 1-like [Mercenaria mercenaria]
MTDNSQQDQVGGRLAVPIWRPLSHEMSMMEINEGTTTNARTENDQHVIYRRTDMTPNDSDISRVFPWFERKQIFNRQSVFEEPQCLISVDEAGSLNVDEKIAKEIEIIDVPVSIVAITGLYRTGKSYLLNRIAGCPKGFSLGNSVKSHTKGIWVWCCLHPTIDQHILMFLDTEGLADVEKADSDYDNRIFSLAVLLSSTLIYNSKGVFNTDDIQKLTFIAQLSENIQVFSETSLDKQVNETLMSFVSPEFILCLRDFFLEMEKSEDEYFEECLANSKSEEISGCIQRYFPRRKCFTIEQPAMGKTHLRQLNSLEDSQLNEDFTADVQKLKEYIYTCEPKYIMADRPVDGLVFVTLMKTYVNALKKGISLNIEEAIENASREHNEKVASYVLRWLDNELRLITLPIPRKEHLQNTFFQLQDKLIRKYRENAYPCDPTSFEAHLKEQMEEKWENLRVENSACIAKQCHDCLAKLDKDIMGDETTYSGEGMYERYKENFHYLEKNYYEQMKKFDRDELIDPLEEFKEFKTTLKAELYRKDLERAKMQQKEQMETMLAQRLQEKYKEMEQEKNLFVEQERKRLLDSLMKQQEVNTALMAKTLQVIGEKSSKNKCNIS